jgi:type II secretory pathway pseudopilin PulG
MLVVMAMMAVVVAVGRRVVMGPAATARRRTTGGRGAHIRTALHLLPSRQMPPIVHHAGVGCVLWLLR